MTSEWLSSTNCLSTVSWLVLHSPLEVVEFHSHSDALAPDHGERVPFSSGTSVSYNYIDYRFRNNTDQNVQLLVWCDEEKLYGELRNLKRTKNNPLERRTPGDFSYGNRAEGRPVGAGINRPERPAAGVVR